MKTTFFLTPIVLSMLMLSGTVTAAENVSALVQTSQIAEQDLTKDVSGYGVVEPDPRGTKNINAPHAGQVTRILILQGEAIAKNKLLLRLATSPRERVNYEQARSGVDLANANLKRMQDLFAQQLATRAQLASAQKEFSDAEAELAAQTQRGTGLPSSTITAPFSGIVSALLVEEGERVQAGATLLRLSQRNRLRIVLGIEPEDARAIQRGMSVLLTPVFDNAERASGLVDTVNDMINPQTGLVDVLVRLQGTARARLMPGERMEGRIVVKSRRTYVVPRQAILSDDQGSYIFVVREGLAHRVNVKTGLETHGLVGITGPFVNDDRVVILGNYELEEGMAVRESRQ